MQKTKKILINAATVKIAGGLIVTGDLLKLIVEETPHEKYLIAPSIKYFKKQRDNLTLITTPNLLLKPYFRWFLDYFWLPAKLKTINPDLVITMGNLPACSRINQVMFNDNAFISQKNLSEIPLPPKEQIKHYLRRHLFWKRLKYVEQLIVQTQTEKDRLLAFKKALPKIQVLPPMLPAHLKSGVEDIELLPPGNKSTIRIAYVSYYWPHKNFELVTKLIEFCALNKLPFQFVLTLNENKKKGGKAIIRKLKPYIRQGTVINVGNIPPAKVIPLMTCCDAVILPSLIETFGLNTLEAWYCKKPLFIADLPYAREVAKNAAVFFNPNDLKELVNKIIDTFEREASIKTLIANGTKELARYNNSHLYLELIKQFLKS